MNAGVSSQGAATFLRGEYLKMLFYMFESFMDICVSTQVGDMSIRDNPLQFVLKIYALMVVGVSSKEKDTY